MSKLVIDIETIGENYDSLDETTQDVLTKWIKTEHEEGSPAPDEKNDSENQERENFDVENITFKKLSEKEMLQQFWQGILKYDQVVTFNGRSFDVPFMMLRSAINGIKPSKNLMPYRYASDTNHLDLYDQLTFYGSSRKKGTLHLFCRAFGIKSPKEGEVDGQDVTRLFNEKKYLEIAKYNVGDLRATRELYLYWEKYLKF